jgi:Tol biopolymer transport system component/predicted Ser/Thr protein kinase
MHAVIGRTLNHYKVLEKIGAGGMGEVYAAEDLKLHRKVAIKVLPRSVADDPGRRARFEREATAVAALNHPAIVTVHSVEEADGIQFITMELVEGKLLAESIPPHGLPLGRFFDLATALADAVAAAHRAGVVHRDLKPENILVASDGRLKVLDFGLAKVQDAPSKADEVASALPTRHLTEQGQILGTVAYMSPEQVEGKAVDHRTDIFSMGVVLYLMATGRRPFQGDTSASMISSILRDAPSPATDLNPDLPRHLSRILRHCLVKDPEERAQSAQDVRNQLLDLRRELDSGALAPAGASLQTRRRAGRRRLAIVAGIAAILLGSLVVVALRRGQEAPQAPGRGLPLAQTQIKLTDFPGEEITPSLSPDGRFVVYAGQAGGDWDLFVQRVGGSNPVNLTEDSTEDDYEPAFSPDGERIAFRSDRQGGGLYVMGATGESVVRLTDRGYYPAWSPDGEQIVFQTTDFAHPTARPGISELWTVDVRTGASKRLFEGDAVQPSWSPGGRRIAFWAIPIGGGQRDIWTLPADGGAPVAVTQDPALDWNPFWSPDGRFLYFSSERGGNMNLWRVPIEEATGRTLGPPEAVTFGAASEIHSASISRDGRRIVNVASVMFNGIRKVSLDVERGSAAIDPASVSRGSTPILWLTLSPDGRSLAYTTIGAGDRPGMVREDIVVSATDGSSRRRVAASDSRNRILSWSPSGDRIAFVSDRSGAYRVYTVRADGSDLKSLDHSPDNVLYPVWSPSGDRIAYSVVERPARTLISRFPPDDRAPEALPPLPGKGENFLPTHWSPDGSRIAGYIDRPAGGFGGIVVYNLETRDYENLTDRGLRPRWLADGRHLLYYKVNSRTIFILDAQTRRVREVPLRLDGTFQPWNVAVSKDGRTLFVTETQQEADLWLLDLQ